MNNEINIDDILAKYFSGEQLTAAENSNFDRWKSEHHQEYQSLSRVMSSAEQSAEIPEECFTVNIDRAWAKVNAKRNLQQTIVPHKKRFATFAVAASVCLLIGTGILFSRLYNPTLTLRTNNETSKSITLADGSSVTLNKNSTLEYKKRMRSSRNVKLTGEAFFDVTPNKAVPFIIETKNAQVKVVGTSFNVKTNAELTTVNVKTGRVELQNNNNNIPIIISAGERGSVSDEKAEKQPITNENYLAWKIKKLVFNATTLNEVATELGNYYGVTIVIEGDARVCNVTTTFTSETLTEALNELKELLHFQYKETSDKIIIYNIECK